MHVFVDMVSVLCIINTIAAIKMIPKKLEKKLKKERKVKEAATVEKKRQLWRNNESSIRVTDLATKYSVSKSTISTI